MWGLFKYLVQKKDFFIFKERWHALVVNLTMKVFQKRDFTSRGLCLLQQLAFPCLKLYWQPAALFHLLKKEKKKNRWQWEIWHCVLGVVWNLCLCDFSAPLAERVEVPPLCTSFLDKNWFSLFMLNDSRDDELWPWSCDAFCWVEFVNVITAIIYISSEKLSAMFTDD